MVTLATAARHAWLQLVGAHCAACGAACGEPFCPPCLRLSCAGGAFFAHDESPAGAARVLALGRYFAGAAPSPLALSLIKFKYAGDRAAGHALRRLFRDAAATLPAGFDAVVPVPLHPRRLRERKYNQSAWLARGAAGALAARLEPNALLRLADTPAQAASAPAVRRKLRGAFRANAGAAQGRSILLVDDVYTTGATAADARRALRQAGATRVVVAVLLVAGNARRRA